MVLYNTAALIAYLLYIRVSLSHTRSPWAWGCVSRHHVLWTALVLAVSVAARLEQLPLLPNRLSLLGSLPSLPYALTVFVLAPIKEEVLYRAILLRRAAGGLGFWPGLILSSLLFGLGHTRPVAASAMGMLLGYMYSPRGTATLLTPILMHAWANLTGLLPVLPDEFHF